MNGLKGGRPGTFRKLAAEKLRQRLIERVTEKADQIFEAWEDAALGHLVEKTNQITGERKVYKKSPNPLAIKDMMEQVWGKPTQPIQVEEADTSIFENEAMRRLGKYADHQDPEYIEAKAVTVSNQGSPVTDTSRYSVRRVGKGFAIGAAAASSAVDLSIPQK